MSVIINIGRSPDNDIVLPESFISARHAQLIRDEDGHWFIHDLGSANGSFVNGKKVTSPTRLSEHDEVVLAGSQLAWKEIYRKYQTADKPASHAKSKWSNYLLGLTAAIALFALLYFVNEFYFTSPSGGHYGRKEKSDSTRQDSKDQKVIPSKKEITYDLSCVTYADNKDINNIAKKLDSLESDYIDHSDITVSLQEEIDFGTEHHQSFLNGGTILTNADSRRLQDILQALVSKITNPRGFHYQLFLVNSKEINSWTSGGRIYFTTAMLNFTRNDDEIAGIIGHEINHNELYHINHLLKAQKLAIQKFGNRNGQIVSTVNKILTAPFSKKDEAHCDLKGEDLVIAAGYDPCNVINLWRRMSELEGTYDPIDNFTRSHPYASTRISCIENHLKVNYNIECPKK